MNCIQFMRRITWMRMISVKVQLANVKERQWRNRKLFFFVWDTCHLLFLLCAHHTDNYAQKTHAIRVKTAIVSEESQTQPVPSAYPRGDVPVGRRVTKSSTQPERAASYDDDSFFPDLVVTSQFLPTVMEGRTGHETEWTGLAGNWTPMDDEHCTKGDPMRYHAQAEPICSLDIDKTYLVRTGLMRKNGVGITVT